MFGPLGFQEVMLILVLALLIFGPRKLPEIGRTIGRTLSEFRKASTELKRSINAEIADEELRQADPRKLVRETYSEVKALKSELTHPFAERQPKAEPEASEPQPESPEPAPDPKAAASAVARGSVAAADAEPDASTS